MSNYIISLDIKSKMSQSEVDATTDHTDHAASAENDSSEESAQLTNKQVKLIVDTWSYVREDLEKAGTVMFMK